jgi:hypothetical protein
MPTPRLYDTIAKRLHGWRRLAGFGFLGFLVLTALCIVAVRARILSPVPLLMAGIVLSFSFAAWCGAVYLLCDWFDPEEGYLRALARPKPGARGASWIRAVTPWISAVFLDVAFLGAAALTLSALYHAVA